MAQGSGFRVLVMIVVVLCQCLLQIVVPACRCLFQIVVTLCSHLSSDTFDEFIINEVISVFHRQRQERDQFAVLIFTEESKLNRMGKTQFQPCDPHAWCNTPLVNNKYSYFPRHNLKNYLVARPDKGHHCEKILLDQEYQLWNAYTEDHPRGPRCILLYSWLLPCSECTSKILTYHSNISAPRPKMVVAYTVWWCEVTEAENQRNIERMQQAGIIIKKIKCPHRLPSAS